jgi:hypothetical protein
MEEIAWVWRAASDGMHSGIAVDLRAAIAVWGERHRIEGDAIASDARRRAMPHRRRRRRGTASDVVQRATSLTA